MAWLSDALTDVDHADPDYAAGGRDWWFEGISYCDFVERIGITLEPGQREVAAVAFDGEDATDPEIWGFTGPVPDDMRKVFVAICGARAGKTYLFSAIRALHLALTVDNSILAPGEEGVVMITGPTEELAMQMLNYVAGAMAHPLLAPYRERPNLTSEIHIKRKHGTVVVRPLAASGKGKNQRGKSLLGAFLDEACFYGQDSSHAVNAPELYKAVVVRIIPGGQVVMASTPWVEGDMLDTFRKRNWGAPVDALVAHAPTLKLRSLPWVADTVAKERVRDPENALREYDAIPLKAGATGYFGPLDDCIVDRLPEGAVVHACAGVDLGFVTDASAMVVLKRVGDVYYVTQCLEVPSPSDPQTTMTRFVDMAREHDCSHIVSDVHYRAALMAIATPTAITDDPYEMELIEADEAYEYAEGIPVLDSYATSADKARAYAKTRTALRTGQLRILRDCPALIGRMPKVERRYLPGGKVTYKLPRDGEGHCDPVAALVAAIYTGVYIDNESIQ